MDIIDCDTQEVKRIWEKTPIPEKNLHYYNFSDFTINLNHLNEELLRKIPVTDTRLRPD